MGIFDRLVNTINQLSDSLFNSPNPYYTSLNLTPQVSQNKGTKFVQAELVNSYYNNSQFLQRTTYVGSDVASKRFFNFEQPFVTPEARKALFAQLEQIRNDDPMVNAGLYILAQGAVADLFTISFRSQSLTQNESKAKLGLEKAQSLMNAVLGDWAENYIFYGDSFIQLVSNKYDKLIKLDEMPVPGIERLCDASDTFPDPSKAFRQRDAISRELYAYFSDFQLIHGRYRKRNGEIYGTSILFPVRQPSIDSIKGYAQLYRRLQRSMPIPTYKPTDGEGNPLVGEALRRFKHGQLGDPSSALPEIRAANGDLSGVETDYPYRICNGGDFDIKSVDVDLAGSTETLKQLTNRAVANLAPRALLEGDVVNYATLNALLKHLYAMQRMLIKSFEYQVVRPIFDRVLLLDGLLPETIPYQLNWGQKYTPQELQDNAKLALAAAKDGKLDQQTTVEVIVEALGRKDSKEILERLREEKAKETSATDPKTFSFSREANVSEQQAESQQLPFNKESETNSEVDESDQVN